MRNNNTGEQLYQSYLIFMGVLNVHKPALEGFVYVYKQLINVLNNESIYKYYIIGYS